MYMYLWGGAILDPRWKYRGSGNRIFAGLRMIILILMILIILIMLIIAINNDNTNHINDSNHNDKNSLNYLCTFPPDRLG